MEQAVIYDSLNYLVWVDGNKPIRGGKGEEKWYGKYAKRFKNNHQTRAYAIKLARQLGLEVFDKYYGEYLNKRKELTPQEKYNKYGILGYNPNAI